MHEVKVDVEQIGVATGALVDQMAFPQLVGQRLGFGHGAEYRLRRPGRVLEVDPLQQMSVGQFDDGYRQHPARGFVLHRFARLGTQEGLAHG